MFQLKKNISFSLIAKNKGKLRNYQMDWQENGIMCITIGKECSDCQTNFQHKTDIQPQIIDRNQKPVRNTRKTCAM